jgi:hypothetical protein
MRVYHIFCHLLPSTDEKGRKIGGSAYPSMVKSFNGTPYKFDDLRTAVTVAERMNRNIQRSKNVRFTAGWSGED